MNKAKKEYSSIFLQLLLIAGLVLVWYGFDVHWIMLILIFILTLSIKSLYKFRDTLNVKSELSDTKEIFETYDYVNLLNLLFLTPFFFFDEIDSQESFSNRQVLISVTLTLIITIIQLRIHLKSYYYIDEGGIHDLDGTLLVDSDKIDQIEFNKWEIIFHTNSKRNDLMIKRYRLASPDWQKIQTVVRQKLRPNVDLEATK